jgi:phage terminase large subunit-like protein
MRAGRDYMLETRFGEGDYDRFPELSLYEGGTGDMPAITEIVRKASASGKLASIGIDTFGAAETRPALSHLIDEELILGAPQNWQATPAIAWCERTLADGKLRHSGATILRWNVGNAVVTRRGNASSITKATAVGSPKIDGVAALLDSASVFLADPDDDVISDMPVWWIR